VLVKQNLIPRAAAVLSTEWQLKQAFVDTIVPIIRAGEAGDAQRRRIYVEVIVSKANDNDNIDKLKQFRNAAPGNAVLGIVLGQ
jgi:hypothetical protein